MEGVSPEAGMSSALDSKQDLVKQEEEEEARASQDGGALKDSTDAELTKISLMRAFVESRDPSSKVLTSNIIIVLQFR